MIIRCWVWKNDPDEDDAIINATDVNAAIDVAAAMFGVDRTMIVAVIEED